MGGKSDIKPLSASSRASEPSGKPSAPAGERPAPLLELVGVSKSLSGKRIIDAVDLTVRGGEILCLLGPSGIGKTTLLEIAAGVARPDGGRVVRRAPASLLFQDDALIPWLDALGNITYVLPRAMGDEKAGNVALEWLDRFGLRPEVFPSAMSGGMRRRLNLARTFAADRSVVILDEPFAFLDDRWGGVIAGLAAAQAAGGRALVVAGHHLPEMLREAAGERLLSASVESQPIRLKHPGRPS
ncbi:MAG: ATP-binding cassette domain-containing protein [Deltaproteobacteria bacterium]|jgi:ABC-type nitrate/sulfonate/bicarbonate transport system ATPase subunit|nr:ATP-binding cassette domain-containing protein [Deltaproteobacteria bacterium]